MQTPWHFTTWLDLLDHWQTVIAGVLALAAGFGTIAMTRRIANRQIAETRKQTETTVRLERTRNASEVLAFRAMLEAAMERVLAEAAWARRTYPEAFTQTTEVSAEALAVRQCITKGGFSELRAVCVRRGDPLTGEFLDLEREIDSFARQWKEHQSVRGLLIRMGVHAALEEQLAWIETKATALREKATERI